VVGASAAAPQEGWDGQERGDLLDEPWGLQHRVVHSRQMCVPAARLTVRDVPRNAAPLANPERPHRFLAARLDHRVDLFTAAAAGDLLVLRAQPTAGTEERALHHRPAHSQAPADLGVRKAFQLPQDDDLVVALAQSAERPTKVVELLAPLEGGIRGGRA
jgi:hypothetical protein